MEKIKYLFIGLFVVLIPFLPILAVIKGIIWMFELGNFPRFHKFLIIYLLILLVTGGLGLILPEKRTELDK